MALVEAVLSGAEEIAMAVLETMEAAGHRTGAISLERQNRLAARLGRGSHSPLWLWRQAPAELLQRQGHRVVVPAPATEDDLTPADLEAVLQAAREATDALVVDLGCRWAPRLFRPVLARATHIWLVVREGQWTALEMRLEQAEFSGWTEMDRLRVLVVGSAGRVPADMNGQVAAVVPDTHGQALRQFIVRELWRGSP